jgi:hypothetical protein
MFAYDDDDAAERRRWQTEARKNEDEQAVRLRTDERRSVEESIAIEGKGNRRGPLQSESLAGALLCECE